MAVVAANPAVTRSLCRPFLGLSEKVYAFPSWKTKPTEDVARGVSRATLVRSGVGARMISEEGNQDDLGIRLECDESGCVFVIGQNVPSLEEDSKGYLQCDLSGCFYNRQKIDNEFKVLEGAGWRLGYETSPESEEAFSAMVGAGGWSIALTAAEYNDFCRLIQMLRKGIMTMDQDGVLGRDEIVLQVEQGNIWMECVVQKTTLPALQRFLKVPSATATADDHSLARDADDARSGSGSHSGDSPTGEAGRGSSQSAFEIRFIISGSDAKRQAEGYWPADAVMDMLSKLDGSKIAVGATASA